MKTIISVMVASASFIGLTGKILAQTSGPYTPEQVYFVLHDAIRQTLGLPLNDPNTSVWLSLSTVGSIIETEDAAHINDIGNFCPPAKPVLEAFGREPKLDAVYQRIIEGSVSPKRTFTPAYKAAKLVLIGADGKPTAEVLKYREMQSAYVTAFVKFTTATTPAERATATLDMTRAQQDWTDQGFRHAVDKARNITSQEEYASGDTRQQRRRDVLDAYKAKGLSVNDPIGVGAYVSPASSFSPQAGNWATSPGWVSVNFSSDTSMMRYNQSESSRSGFGGLSLGFVSIGGTTGGRRSTESKVKEVYKLTYEFELMKASINRPWLDTTLMFLPQDWTWTKRSNTKEFPYVAVSRETGSGRPLPSPAVLYNNAEVGCALLPVEAVIARKRKIVATIKKEDYSSVTESGSAGGGGSLFGIFGGAGNQNWSTNKISEDATTVTFSVQADGIAVIGLVSQFVPQSPSPNVSDSWPKEAWLPEKAAPATK